MKMATMKDIAEKAEVSMMTVSNVMNGNTHKMSEKTFAKVMKAINELEYVPNASARSLTLQRSNIIALWLPSYYTTSLLEIPYNSYIAGAIERYIHTQGYNLMLVSDPTVESFANRLLSWNIDGGIGLGIAPEDVSYIEEKLNKPFIFIDSYFDSETVHSISTNDYKGGYIGTQFLVEKGHKNIGIVTGTEVYNKKELEKNGVLFNRFKGYVAGLKDKNIQITEEFFIGEDISYDGGVLAGRRLARLPEITGVFCTADIMAAGVCEGLRQEGKNVPDDLSVVGFDDLPISRYVTPKLTTVRQHNKAKGEKAVDMLVELIKKENIENKHFLYDVEMVERESVKAVR